MSAPKSLWRPTLVLLDEAHMFCPERAAGDAESTQSVIDLASQGRKRGYCAVLATQRLSKLHKDAAAECNNVFIGRTGLDIDAKRALDLLGMGSSERAALRDLSPGEFFGFGPALESHAGVLRFKTGPVKSEHPKAGQRHKLFGGHAPKPAASSPRIKQALAELADLPQQAEAEARDLEGARRRIRELEHQLRHRARAALDPAELERVKAAASREAENRAKARPPTYRAGPPPADRHAGQDQRLGRGTCRASNGRIFRTAFRKSGRNRPHVEHVALAPAPRRPRPPADTGRLPNARRCSSPSSRTMPTGEGGFGNYLSSLRTKGFVEDVAGGQLRIMPEGLEALGPVEPLPKGRELLDHWLRQLGKAERLILEALYEAWPERLSKEELAQQTGYAADGGGFGNALSKLRTLGLIHGDKAGLFAGESFFT